MKHLITQYFAAAFAAVAFTAHAGQPVAVASDKKSVATAKEEKDNPLGFFDDRVVFDAEYRSRFEAANNIRDFSSVDDPSDDEYLLSRFRLGLTLTPSDWITIYGQGQDAREFFSDKVKEPGVAGAGGDDAFDLRQAYIKLGNLKEFPLELTLGRHRLDYGSRRLVADPNWSNLGRTFDAVELRYEPSKNLSIDAFYGNVVEATRAEFNESDSDQDLYGVFASSGIIPNHKWELYSFYVDSEAAVSAGEVLTFGTRLVSKERDGFPWDYEGEFVYQTGDVRGTIGGKATDLDLSAFATHVGAGYTFDFLGSTRLGLNYDYASGDSDPGDGESQRFQNLYPSTHPINGLIDALGWANLHDVYLQVGVEPTKKLEFNLEYHLFWLADTSDFAYRSNGTSAIRSKSASGRDVRTIGADSFFGHKLDLTADYKVSDWLKLHAGFSVLFAGDYLDQTGEAEDATFAYGRFPAAQQEDDRRRIEKNHDNPATRGGVFVCG
jgi:hypothetical protein